MNNIFVLKSIHYEIWYVPNIVRFSSQCGESKKVRMRVFYVMLENLVALIQTCNVHELFMHLAFTLWIFWIDKSCHRTERSLSMVRNCSAPPSQVKIESYQLIECQFRLILNLLLHLLKVYFTYTCQPTGTNLDLPLII